MGRVPRRAGRLASAGAEVLSPYQDSVAVIAFRRSTGGVFKVPLVPPGTRGFLSVRTRVESPVNP